MSLRALVVTLLLVLATPVALADESHADCEDEQPWIGYRSTDPARQTAQALLASTGIQAAACEGEQWDGQDAIDGGETLAFGMGADPNDAPSADPAALVGFRVTLLDAREAYAAANVAYVGRVALYAGTCGAGEPGLEGGASCDGTRELRVGAYARDNTPFNLITHFSPQCLFSLTGCPVQESDCSQEVYQHSQYTGQRLCARDNTAIGVALLLP